MRRSPALVLLVLFVAALIIAAALPAGAAGEPVPKVGGAWPVGVRPAVVRGWEPPATEYGRGHRGVDLAAAPCAVVRAVAAGRVSFAGRVAGRGVIAVELAGTGDPPLRTTYGPVRAAVEKGDEVVTGEALGVLELPATAAHCRGGCLHWGLLRADVYLDPLSLLPPWLLRHGASRLLPVIDVPRPGPLKPPRPRAAPLPGLRGLPGPPPWRTGPPLRPPSPRAVVAPGAGPGWHTPSLPGIPEPPHRPLPPWTGAPHGAGTEPHGAGAEPWGAGAEPHGTAPSGVRERGLSPERPAGPW